MKFHENHNWVLLASPSLNWCKNCGAICVDGNITLPTLYKEIEVVDVNFEEIKEKVEN